MSRIQWIDQCTNWLNYLLQLSPDLESYSVGFDKDRRKWVFVFQLRDGKTCSLDFFEDEIDMDTYDLFKEDLGRLLR